jgi:hypothetical protein
MVETALARTLHAQPGFQLKVHWFETISLMIESDRGQPPRAACFRLIWGLRSAFPKEFPLHASASFQATIASAQPPYHN